MSSASVGSIVELGKLPRVSTDRKILEKEGKAYGTDTVDSLLTFLTVNASFPWILWRNASSNS